MKLSLKNKLIISYALLFLFLVSSLFIAFNYLVDKYFQDYIMEQQHLKNQNIVDTVRAEYQETLTPSPEFFASLGQAALNQGIVLMVSDLEGEKVFCMKYQDDVACENMLESMEETMRRLYPDFPGEYTEEKYPVVIDGKNVALITLGYYGPFYYSSADVHFLSVINRILFFAALGFLLLAIVFSYFFAERISQPLKMVTAQAKLIKSGHYENKINHNSTTKEISDLIDSINALAAGLEAQLASKKRMARDYAHEFRTPLAAIQSNLEGMIDGVFETTPERLESLRTEILRLSRMVAEIDKIVELETIKLHKENFSLSTLVSQSVAAYEKQCLDKAIQITITQKETPIYADKDKIQQVLTNLISNAIKYVGQNGRVKISLKEYRNVVVLVVSDDGIGIAPEDLPHIFDHLYRADLSRSRDTGGSGIGLSVVAAIVEAHGGTIEVQSELKKGSHFTVKLPKI